MNLVLGLGLGVWLLLIEDGESSAGLYPSRDERDVGGGRARARAIAKGDGEQKEQGKKIKVA